MICFASSRCQTLVLIKALRWQEPCSVLLFPRWRNERQKIDLLCPLCGTTWWFLIKKHDFFPAFSFLILVFNISSNKKTQDTAEMFLKCTKLTRLLIFFTEIVSSYLIPRCNISSVKENSGWKKELPDLLLPKIQALSSSFIQSFQWLFRM